MIASHTNSAVFCGTKLSCERTAQQLALQLPAASSQDLDARSKLLAALRQAGGVDPMLQETVPKGVAFHHAGLTAEERSVLETGFRSGALRVLTATSTLAAGVNLPARRVLVREPHFGKKIPLDKARYNQMCGRAGRTGLDDQGESYLLSPRPQDYALVKALSAAPLTPLKSVLEMQADGLCRCVLEGVSGSGANTHAELMRYLSCTLLAAQSSAHIAARLDEALTCLIESGFVAPVRSPTDELRLTKLGRATVSAAMYPEEALAVFEGLELAKHGLQLHHDLHLTFLVTPVHHQLTPDWGRLLEHLQFLSDAERGVLSVLRVEESALRALKMDPRYFERNNAPTVRPYCY